MSNIESLGLSLGEERYGVRLEDSSFTRRIALEIDQDPLRIDHYKKEPIIQQLCSERDESCLDRTKQAEILAYGDASAFVACPGPSLAGAAIREMADDKQKGFFFDYVKESQCTTFAAITEPGHGCDVASIQTKIEKSDSDYYHITGEKCFISHGADGKIGIVVGRTSSGPFGITGVIVTADDIKRGETEGTIKREFLPIIGMKGTCLSSITFRNFSVPVQALLGQHLRVTHRGMLPIIKTFNLMRPCVSGFVLGQAQGIVDYISSSFKSLPFSTERLLAVLNADISTARSNLYVAAVNIDSNPLDSSGVSLSKAQLTHLVEHICSVLTDELNPSLFCEHPLLLKWFRDVYGFEYMEGTTNMQKRNVYQKHLRMAPNGKLRDRTG